MMVVNVCFKAKIASFEDTGLLFVVVVWCRSAAVYISSVYHHQATY